MHDVDGDQPLYLRPTKLGESYDKYVKRLIKILVIKRFNYM